MTHFPRSSWCSGSDFSPKLKMKSHMRAWSWLRETFLFFKKQFLYNVSLFLTTCTRTCKHALILLSCQPWQQRSKNLPLASSRCSAVSYSPSSLPLTNENARRLLCLLRIQGQQGWVGSSLSAQWMLEGRKKTYAVCYHNGCLIEMQLAHFYGCVLYHNSKPRSVRDSGLMRLIRGYYYFAAS